MGPVSPPAPPPAPSPRGFGRGTSSVSARRHRVVWSGTARSSPSRPMTEPISPSVCRYASRNTALNVSAVRIARSEYSGCPPRLVRRSASHASTASSENQTVKLPRRRRLSSYSRQFVTLRFCSGMWWRRSWFSLKGKAGIPAQTEGCPATSIGPRVLPVGSLQQRVTIGHIAAVAGVCAQTVRNALRVAQRLGFVHVEQRRVSAWRNRPNRVTILSPEWTTWLRMARRGGASKFVEATPTQEKNEGTLALRNRTWAAEGGSRGVAARRKTATEAMARLRREAPQTR